MVPKIKTLGFAGKIGSKETRSILSQLTNKF
jgi:hypothetical protein